MNNIIDYVKYNKLLDPNRETDKVKVEFLKDTGSYKTGDRRIIKTEDFLLYSERGDCKSVEESNSITEPAFEWYTEIEKLESIGDKHRALLKRYTGLNYTCAKNKEHEQGWNELTPYDDSLYSERINKVSRRKDELTLEFDEVEGEPDNPKESLELLKQILEHYGIGYYETSHESKNSNHIHIEFLNDVTEEQAKNFIGFLAPKGSRIDLNFCRDKFLFPVMYAEHWKYPGVRELPVNLFKGRKLDLEACKIPEQNIKSTTKIGSDGFKYETYVARKNVEDFLIIKVNEETGKEISRNVNVDKVADYVDEKYHFKTIENQDKEKVFYFNGKHYDNGGRAVAKEETEKLLKQYSKINPVREILGKIERRNYIDKDIFEKTDLSLIPLNNGVLEMENRKLNKHSPDYYFKSVIPIDYDVSAECPVFLKFLNETLYPEDIPVMQEWFGYNLFREYAIKKAMVCLGQRDTGKTVLLEVLTDFIGEVNKTGLSLQKIGSGSDFIKISLRGKMSNIYDDLSSRDINDGGNFKIATGGGNISAEEKFGGFYQFRNYAKHTFATNKIPPVKDNDDMAYFSRWIVIRMDNPPEKKDLFLKKKIFNEKPGILNWALVGLKRLLENGDFSYNKTPEEVKAIMEMSGDTLLQFGGEVLEKANGKISKEEMYKVYCEWANKNDKPVFSKTQLGNNLHLKIKYLVAKVGAKERFWDNVKLKDSYIGNHKPSNLDTLDTLQNNMREYEEVDNNTPQTFNIISERVSKPSNKDIPLCPKCSSPTKLSKTMKGKQYLCINYAICGGIAK